MWDLGASWNLIGAASVDCLSPVPSRYEYTCEYQLSFGISEKNKTLVKLCPQRKNSPWSLGVLDGDGAQQVCCLSALQL